jgi:hypothetical protein
MIIGETYDVLGNVADTNPNLIGKTVECIREYEDRFYMVQDINDNKFWIVCECSKIGFKKIL